jgi:hypothetical protein
MESPDTPTPKRSKHESLREQLNRRLKDLDQFAQSAVTLLRRYEDRFMLLKGELDKAQSRVF